MPMRFISDFSEVKNLPVGSLFAPSRGRNWQISCTLLHRHLSRIPTSCCWCGFIIFVIHKRKLCSLLMHFIQPRNLWKQWTATAVIRSQSKVVLKLIANFLPILLICILFSVFPITYLVTLLIRTPRRSLLHHSVDSLCSRCLFLWWVLDLQQQRNITSWSWSSSWGKAKS